MFKNVRSNHLLINTKRTCLFDLKCKLFKVSILSLFFPLFCFSQVKITGKVIDENGPIVFANVVLTDQNGKIVNGTITNENGNYEIQGPKETYNFLVSYLGYEDYKTELVLDIDKSIADIVLKKSADQLDEVIISAKKNIIERKVDRLVFNVENNIATTGGNALDALRISPGIFIGNEGQVAMIGKSGMRVMIDGRIIQLTGQELTDFLNSIPADDIKEIEIITNPPAKYEAQGNSGLINIIYKKGRNNSWSNTSVASYTQAELAVYGLKNNFNYKKNKLSLLVSLSGDIGDRHVIQEGETFYSDGPWRFDIDQEGKQDNFSGRLMLDYDLGEKSTIGIQYMGALSNPDVIDNTVTRIFNNSNSVDSLLINDRFAGRDLSYHSLNTHFKTEVDTLGRTVSVDLDYFDFKADELRDVVTENFLPSNESLGISFSDRTILDQTLNNFNARLDVEHPFESFNLSYGANVSFIDNTYKIQSFNTISGTPVINPLQSDDFEYSENKQALYVNLSKKINEKLETQIGLRAENTQAEGISNRLSETNKFEYLEFFPTVYLSYSLNDANSFSFNYGRRINRPSFGQLNPARNYINSNTFSVGNPFLQPSFTDNLELTHTYKGKLVTQLFLSYESDGFGSVFSADNDTNIQSVIKENYFNRYDYGISQFYTFNEISWWESQNSIYLLNSDSKIFNRDIDAEIKNSFRYYIATNNSFALNKSKTIKSQVNFWYSSAYDNNIYEYSDGYKLDAVLQFNFMQKQLQTSIGVYDIFNSSPFSRTTEVNDVRQVYTVFPSNRYFRMSLVYKMGSKKVKVRGRKFGNEEDQNRVN